MTAPTAQRRRITARHIVKMLMQERDHERATLAREAYELSLVIPLGGVATWEELRPMLLAASRLTAAQERLNSATGV